MKIMHALMIAMMGLGLACGTVGCKKEEPAAPAADAIEEAAGDAADAVEGAADAVEGAADAVEKAAE